MGWIDVIGPLCLALAAGIPGLVGVARSVVPRIDRALRIAERGAVAAERIADRLDGADYVRLPRRDVEAVEGGGGSLPTPMRRPSLPPRWAGPDGR